jgi:hypothetical protein
MSPELSTEGSEYLAALSDYEAAKHGALQIAGLVIDVAKLLRVPGQFLFKNSSSGDRRDEIPQVSNYDESEWPTGEEISVAIGEWHRAFYRVQDARKRLTSAEAAELPQPPTLIELRHTIAG